MICENILSFILLSHVGMKHTFIVKWFLEEIGKHLVMAPISQKLNKLH